MSKHSLSIAVKYGETLREFRDQFEAEDYYISYKNDLLNRLKAISVQAYEKQSFDKVGLTQEEFESMMAVY